MPSWNLNVGAKTIYNQKRKTDFFGDFGIGKAYKFNNMIFYSFLNTSFHSNFPYIKVKPNFNINFDMLDTKNLISAGISINPYNNDSNEFFKFKSQYNISQKLSFELNFEKNVYEKSYLNLKFFF